VNIGSSDYKNPLPDPVPVPVPEPDPDPEPDPEPHQLASGNCVCVASEIPNRPRLRLPTDTTADSPRGAGEIPAPVLAENALGVSDICHPPLNKP
jgi:hypothetical protein